MSDDFNFSTYKAEGNGGTIFSVSVLDHVFHTYGKRVIAGVFDAVAKQLSEEWIARHGAEVLDQLAPSVVKDTIEKAIKDRIAEKVFK